MNNGSDKIKKFTDLYAWQEGHKLVLMVYKITDKFPEKEKYSIIDQMRRAAVSLTSNIAEGFSRRSSKEKNRFYDMAQASLVELQNQFIISKDVNYIEDKSFGLLANQSVIVSKVWSGFMRSTKDRKF